MLIYNQKRYFHQINRAYISISSAKTFPKFLKLFFSIRIFRRKRYISRIVFLFSKSLYPETFERAFSTTNASFALGLSKINHQQTKLVRFYI